MLPLTRSAEKELEVYYQYPGLDSHITIELAGDPVDLEGAVPRHPTKCAAARTCHRANMEVAILGSTGWWLAPATQALIDYNRRMNGPKSVAGIKVGDIVRWTFNHDSRLRAIVDALDHGTRLVPGGFALLRVTKGRRRTRNKLNSSRRDRDDSRLRGVPVPPERKRVARIGRLALMREAAERL